MPLFDDAQLINLRFDQARDAREGHRCKNCSAQLWKNYCRSCDEFFTDGHYKNCSEASKHQSDPSKEHRTY